MELRDLNYLRAIATNGHLGRSAQSVGLTQPALTKCIARLERELAVDLLERTPRGVRLTVCGEHLVAHAGRLHAADADIRRQLQELATGQVGHVRIGTGLAASQQLLPKACIALLKRHPGVTTAPRATCAVCRRALSWVRTGSTGPWCGASRSME